MHLTQDYARLEKAHWQCGLGPMKLRRSVAEKSPQKLLQMHDSVLMAGGHSELVLGDVGPAWQAVFARAARELICPTG
jgi:hypothetical protein